MTSQPLFFICYKTKPHRQLGGNIKSPEILAPVGNKEAFFATIDAGADAIYLGLQNFSARARANNFCLEDLPFILKYAHNNQTKIYITINTLIKNRELPELIKTLFFLNKLKVDAIIFQDWAVLYIVKNLFPTLTLHASTQLGIHNSAGANFAKRQGIERVVLSREITKSELASIRKKSKAELELFVHGALCYSFSGECLFSSFIGSCSGNRGQCKQPCRRLYNDKYLFNLSDLQLLKHLLYLEEIGVDSLKIEGRMKSAEYIYNVVKAYKNKAESVQDFGREKTEYFFGEKLNKPIIDFPYTGELIGTISKVGKSSLDLDCKIKLSDGLRIRILSKNGYDAQQFKVKTDNLLSPNSLHNLPPEITQSVEIGDNVFLVGQQDYKPKAKFQRSKLNFGYDPKVVQKLIGKSKRVDPIQRELFVKIDSLEWLRKVDLRNMDKLILDFDKISLGKLDLSKGFLQKFKEKLIVELPTFVSENNIVSYQNLVTKLYKGGVKNFACYKSQEELLLPGCTVYYKDPMMNDLAIRTLNSNNFFYPQEGEFENEYRNRNGIFPLYFTPKLFYSRCPIADFEQITVDQFTLKKQSRNGFTVVYPDKPVSILEEKDNLYKKGFRRFLIDLSFCKPSKNILSKLIREYAYPKDGIAGYKFNFKRGLK